MVPGLDSNLGLTEERDREAQAHSAIVFLAPLEKYFAALGPDSLAPLSELHCKNDHLYKKSGGTLAFVV